MHFSASPCLAVNVSPHARLKAAMTNGLRRLMLIACAAALGAQTPGQNPQLTGQPIPQQSLPQPVGLETDWEIGGVLKEIAAHASRLTPALERIDARSWVDQGASETYGQQLQSAKDQARALNDGAAELVKNPERLSALLDVFFRIQAIDSMLGSVEEGIRKYGYKPDAQTLVGLQAETGANRDRLQRYIVNLAAEREREFQAMDREAQRCRAVVTAPRSGKKK
jgi:hypothetical protein